jgi:hypothetical protein
MFRTIIASTVVTGAVIAGSFGVANAASVPVAHAPVTCAAQLRVVNRAIDGHGTPADLTRVSLPELARTARAAASLAGARWYGVALQATADDITSGSAADHGDCAGHRDESLPSWFHWDGTTASPCIVAWGRMPGHKGNTSAQICGIGTAHLS